MINCVHCKKFMGHSMVNHQLFYLTPSEFDLTCWKPSLGRNIGENQILPFSGYFKGYFWPLEEWPLKRLKKWPIFYLISKCYFSHNLRARAMQRVISES